MTMLIKQYYYTLKDFEHTGILLQFKVSPYGNSTFKSFIETRCQITVATDLAALPFSINDSNVEKVWQEVVSSNYKRFIMKTSKEIEDTSIDLENIKEWAFKFINLLTQSYDYFNTLLNFYASEKTHLMDDITATSENQVGFNDTPQNANTLDVYEGDNYLTHFTKTRGSNSSPLMSKIMRLKEIQDNFKDCLHDWAKYLSRVWLTEGE